MSDTLTPVITDVGLAAVFNAQHNGLQAQITHIALGDAGWKPDTTATALRQEKQRIPASGEAVSATQLHITGLENGDTSYWIREIGFYLSDGTLFAIKSHETQPMAYKTAGVDVTIAFDLVLTALPANSVVIDTSSGFSIPLATSSQRGIIRIATQTEVNDGSIDDAAVTPATLPDTPQASDTQQGISRFATQAEANARSADNIALSPAILPTATQSRQGVMRFATQAEVSAGNATQAAVTPAQLSAHHNDTSIVDAILAHDGEGSGLDADLLRGLPADFGHLLSANGYQKFPSGLILQWGKFTHPQRPYLEVDHNYDGYYLPSGCVRFNINFPVTFLNACLFVAKSIPDGPLGILSFNQSGFLFNSIRRMNIIGHPWLAIGY